MFKKPNTKSITKYAVAGGSIVVGAKIGDGVSAIMPDSTKGYKKWILGVGGIVAAASINSTTQSGEIIQCALLGMGAKQLYDEIGSTLAAAIPVKLSVGPAALGVTDRFLNAVVGHDAPVAALGAWSDDNSEVWERPDAQDQPALAFTGM